MTSNNFEFDLFNTLIIVLVSPFFSSLPFSFFSFFHVSSSHWYSLFCLLHLFYVSNFFLFLPHNGLPICILFWLYCHSSLIWFFLTLPSWLSCSVLFCPVLHLINPVLFTINLSFPFHYFTPCFLFFAFCSSHIVPWFLQFSFHFISFYFFSLSSLFFPPLLFFSSPFQFLNSTEDV